MGALRGSNARRLGHKGVTLISARVARYSSGSSSSVPRSVFTAPSLHHPDGTMLAYPVQTDTHYI